MELFNTLPLYISITFILTTLITAWHFISAYPSSKKIWIAGIVVVWLALQTVLPLNNFYLDFEAIPPRMIFAIGPPFFAIVLFLIFTKTYPSSRALSYLHWVRIPVELGLFWLVREKVTSEFMSFEGRNFDIISGITMPIFAYLYYDKKVIGRGFMLFWNFVCLALVINVLAHGILSAPTPFQQLGFDQPNIGVFYFPFIWLPVFIVPVVLFSHFVCILDLIKNKK